MEAPKPSRIRRYLAPALMLMGLIAFIIFSGVNGTCRICVVITDTVGLTEHGSGRSAFESMSAPAWQLRDLEGNIVSSASLEGKVLLVDFWATWCPPCRRMIPGLVDLEETYGPQGFAVVGISLDRAGMPVVRDFNQQYGVQYLSLMGDAGVVEAFGGIDVIPTSFLINRQGMIVARHTGYVSKRQLIREIEPLL